MIYRDDDISKYTDLTTIINVHKLFIKYNKIHTVTLLMEDLWESRGVWEWLMTTSNLDIALHGWRHVDYSVPMTCDDIVQALLYWQVNTDRMGYRISLKTFYPPWNKVCDKLRDICKRFGLELNDCVNPKKVYNFHWFDHIGGRNLDKLEEVLKNDC